MYIPEADKLQGLTIETAECMGKPHVGARYLFNEGVNRYTMDLGTPCSVCGKSATNVHHQPNKGRGRILILNGHMLRPALFALCGSGTTGCHGKIHQQKLKIVWRWTSEEYAREWWEGGLLEEVKPHSEELYNYGFWDFVTLYDGIFHFGDNQMFL